MLKKLYTTLIIFGIVTGIFLFTNVEQFSSNFLLYFSLVPFFLFVTGFHGLIAHSKLMKHEDYIFFPIAMGALYVALLAIHVFFLTNKLCPCFLN